MTLDDLRHKLRYLETRCPAGAEAALAASVGAALPAGPASDGARAALLLDAVYAVARNRHWLATPLFGEALAESLASAHGLDRRAAAALAGAAIHAAADLLPARASHVGTSDRELLRYVFVHSLVANDEAALALDLGLGSGLLGRIRDAVRGDDGAGAYRFVPAIDAQIAAALAELADELAAAPHAADVHRLRYALAEVGEPWREAIEERGAGWLFELLVAMGRARTLTVRQVREAMERTLADALGVEWPRHAPGLLQTLHRHELAVAAGGHGEAERWELLPRGQALTAAAVAAALIAERTAAGTDPLTDLAGLCPAYQAQLVRDTPSLDADSLERLARAVRPLSPQAVDAALGRLAQAAGTVRAAAVAAEVAAGDASPWLRRAAEAARQRLAGTIVAPVSVTVARSIAADTGDEF